MKNILKNLGATATAAGKNYTLMLLLLVWKNSTRGCGEFPLG